MKKTLCAISLMLCLAAAAPMLSGCGDDAGTGTVITTSPLPDSKLESSERAATIPLRFIRTMPR